MGISYVSPKWNNFYNCLFDSQVDKTLKRRSILVGTNLLLTKRILVLEMILFGEAVKPKNDKILLLTQEPFHI